VNDLKRSLAAWVLGISLAIFVGGDRARADAANPPAARPDPNPTAPSAASEPALQVTGRVIHTWYEKPDLRVLLIIDGFTVMTPQEQLTARDGVVWFDEAEAKKTGKVTLGLYAETEVEYRRADGQVETYDSAYLVMTGTGEINLHSDEPLRGKADNTELFLRAKKMRREYLEAGVHETPTGVVPPPKPAPKVEPPGVREAGVPQEISIVAQDDVRQVNFTSFVEDGMRISLWTGGVYVTRGDMELAADNLVIWTPEEAVRKAAGSTTPEKKTEAAESGPATPGGGEALPPADGRPPGGASRRLAAEAYFEGHVQLIVGHRILQCSQLFYDFQREQALAINTKLRTHSKARGVPVYYYAKEMRQLAKNLFVGTNAWMTTCEFAHPHYKMGGTKLTLTDLSTEAPATEEPSQAGARPEERRIRFVGDNVQTRVRGLPLTYWPRLAGDLTESETALRSIRIENRSNRGTGLVTQWHLMKLLGIEKEPPGFDFYLNADFWSERGPALGVESDYLRKDFYGEFLSYYLHDAGKDSVGSSDIEPNSTNRGRVLWRHRQYLPQGWELTLEFSKITDKNFLNEFFEKEDETGKGQETVLYLKKQEHEQAVTLLASARLNDWYTRTEYYPQLGYNVIGRSFLKDHLTYFQDSELSAARYRPSEQSAARSSDSTLLADTIHEVDLPLKWGPVNVVPFAEGRLSYFGEVLDRSGSEWRLAGKEGARAATQAWRTYDGVESEFWDLHRLRHINIFDVSAYVAQVSVPSRELIPFDVTEAGTPVVQGVDGTGVVELGWRQRLQTKRGPPNKPQNVDWLTMDLEATFYNNRESPGIAPDGKRAYNHLDHLVTWQVTDSATVWTDTNYNTDDGTLDLFAVGTTITHSPRLSYTIAHHYIPDGHSALTSVSFEYRINEKWQVHVLQQYDFDRQENAQSDFLLIRRMHRWIMRLRLKVDPGQDENFVGIELQPVGFREIRLGGG
jgi:hypothetical protein